MSTQRFIEFFGSGGWRVLKKPYFAYLANGGKIKLDKVVTLTIIIDGNELVDVVHLSDNVTEVEGQKLPDIIIGSGTMDKYGIELDPVEG